MSPTPHSVHAFLVVDPVQDYEESMPIAPDCASRA